MGTAKDAAVREGYEGLKDAVNAWPPKAGADMLGQGEEADGV